MHFLGKVIKYLLRSIFSIIVFVLLVGLAKTHWNIWTYVDFLNTNDRSSLRWSESASWTDVLWPTNQTSDDISDILADDTSMSGLDVYDPAFEDELNEFSESSLSGEEDFWFTTETTTTSETHNSSEDSSSSDTSITSKTELLNLIKQRELTK